MNFNVTIVSNFYLFIFFKKKNSEFSLFLTRKKFFLPSLLTIKSKNWKYKINKYFSVLNFIKTHLYIRSFDKILLFNRFPKYIIIDWAWEISLGIFFILFGFFSATSAITIIGSVADWDPLAAAVMLCWTEFFTKIFYYSDHKTFKIKLINSFKIGINFGMFVDALKLTS
jgi:hypothetical protein